MTETVEHSAEHTVKIFDEELRAIGQAVGRMGRLALNQFDSAIRAVETHDHALATGVVAGDRRIDLLEQDVDGRVVRLLALRQPVANDLRAILGALKIASDLERIGDLAANIAKRTLILGQVPPAPAPGGAARMGQLAADILGEVMAAYGGQDSARAMAAWRRDAEIDEMYNSLFREMLTYMMEDPRHITAGTHLLFIAKNIERIGDHATNIAETVYFLVQGHWLREPRPKRDLTGGPTAEMLAELEGPLDSRLPPPAGEDAP